MSLSPVTSLASGRSLPRQYTIDQILGNPPRDTKDPSKLQLFINTLILLLENPSDERRCFQERGFIHVKL